MKCVKCKNETGSGRKVLSSFSIVPEKYIENDYCVTCFYQDKEKFKEKIIVAISATSEKVIHEYICPDCPFNIKNITEGFGKDEWDKKYLEHRMTHQRQENLENEKKIDSLYYFIKKISEEKGRKLKVVCDWDETVQDRTSFAIYESSGKDINFDEFFENFWVIVDRDFDKKIKEIEKQVWDCLRDSPGFYQISPFLSNAQGLLRCLEDNLIDKLIFLTGTHDDKETHYEALRVEKDATFDQIENAYKKIVSEFSAGNNLQQSDEVKKKIKKIDISRQVLSNSSWKSLYDRHGDNWGKREKFQKTFGKFPQSSMVYAAYDPEKVKTYDWVKWEWVRKNCPDFDLFVDDYVSLMDNRRVFYSNREELNSDTDRYYVLPNYKNTKVVKGKNVYYVKTSVSNLKDEDFVESLMIEEKQLQETKQKITGPQAKLKEEENQKGNAAELETENQFREEEQLVSTKQN